MLVGESYKGHIDAELLEVRRSCRAAVERWNEAHQYTRATSDEEKGRLFRAIVDPCQRPDINHPSHDTSNSLIRPGSLGSRVVIISPFTCDYGYNIHIGDDTYIGANCVMEDAGKVSIGSRVHVGKDVLFCATNDPINRLGSQADLTAGAIIVEDEVIIGPRTTILPYRVIGKGATIAAGSVVTKVRLPARTRSYDRTQLTIHSRTSHPIPLPPAIPAESSGLYTHHPSIDNKVSSPKVSPANWPLVRQTAALVAVSVRRTGP